MPMTKPVSNSLAPDQIGTTAMVDEGMQMVKAQLAATTVLPQKIWETQFAITSEILAFLGRRMQAQAEFCAKLGHCKEIGEAVDAQQDKLSTLARKNMDAWTGVGAQYVSGWTGNHKAAA